MAKPELQLLIDWNNDGDFLDTYDDVTSDVVSVAVDHLRDMQTEYMNARVLDFVLLNSDHKYSPSKNTIPTADLVPGRTVWFRMWYPYDGFDRNSGVEVVGANHPDDDWSWIGAKELYDQDGSGNAQTKSTQGDGDCIVVLNFLDTDVSIASNFTRGTDTDHGGLCIRYVNTSNYAYVRVTGSALELRKVISGSDSLVATAAYTWGTSTTKFLHVAIHGYNCRVFVDNVEVIDATLNDSAINSGTRHGLFSDDEADHKWQDFGGFKSVFYGILSRIRPRPRQGDQYCYMQAIDHFEKYKVSQVRYLNYRNGAAGTFIDLTLGTMHANAIAALQKEHFDAGTVLTADVDKASPQDNVGLKALDDSFLNLIYAYQDEEDGFIYVDGQGFLRFENRTHRAGVPHTASRATINDTYDGTNPGFTNMSWSDGTENVENYIQAQVTRSVIAGARSVVWESEQAKDTSISIAFDALEGKNFIAEVSSDAAYQHLIPRVTTDYLAFVNADGSGTNLTTQLTVTAFGLVTDALGGKYYKVRVVFGGTAGYLTFLRVTALTITLQDPTVIEDHDDTSLAAYGERRPATIICQWIDRDATARAMLASRLARRKDPKTLIELNLINHDKPTLHHMVQRRISDRLKVVYSDMGINEDFFLEGESWRVDRGGMVVEQTLQLRGV